MRVVILLIILFGILSCKIKKKQKSFDEFDFTFTDIFSTHFSIKFTQGDTVFIREHWSVEEKGMPISKTNYISLLNHSDRLKLESLIKEVNFQTLDTNYYEEYSDGFESKFYIKNDGASKLISLHSYNAPKKLDSLNNWIVELKRGLKLNIIKNRLQFSSLFLPPEPPPPPPPPPPYHN